MHVDTLRNNTHNNVDVKNSECDQQQLLREKEGHE
jgi:hypothetical protein